MIEVPRAELVRYVDGRFPGAEVTALAGDASTRRFWRVRTRVGTTFILMDYGHDFERETDDVRLHRVFTRAALPVAQIVEVVPDPGCLLLEDLGDTLLETAWRERPDLRRSLLERAVQLAAAVAERGTRALLDSERSAGPALDAARFRFEMDFFMDHYVVDFMGLKPQAHVREALYELAERAAVTPRPVLCHRDFHGRNLLVATDGSLTMVDIQDARWGPDSYDLASLLWDAYLEVEEDRIAPSIALYLSRLGEVPERGDFRSRLEVVAAQRMIKALGTFGYQSSVLGRTGYSRSVPSVLDRLRRLLPVRTETLQVYRALDSSGLLRNP